MAVTLRSVGVSPGANTTSCVIVKPAGLAVDDLMVAQVINAIPSGTPAAVTAPEGWTEIRQDSGISTRSALFWKIAVQADVDATDFTFTTASNGNMGAISAWTGHNSTTPINANNGQFNAASATVTAPAITPSVADCMICLFCGIEDNNTQSGYAIATSNPASWTEAYDLSFDATLTDMALAIGYAIRPETTSTGNGTATSSASDVNIGQLVAIAPEVVVTEKTSSDTGSGADAKKAGEPRYTLAVRSDSGSGVDGHKAVAPQSAGETGSGVDALTALLGILARSETGLGTDTKLSLAVALIKADSGSGVEHILDRALVLISESGSGLDVSHLVKTLMLSDGGTAAENSYLHILEGVKSSSDSGAGAEASSLAASFERDEMGAGVEAVVARALYAREYPTGALDLAKVITATITGTGETGTGAEASLVSFYQKKTDSGEGVDSSTLEALFSRDDVGAGAEAITLLAAMLASDSGQAVETVLSYLRQLVDSGEGSEVVNIIGAVGRAMKLITYLRAYSDLTVYTKPYSNLIVYTSEVKKQ